MKIVRFLIEYLLGSAVNKFIQLYNLSKLVNYIRYQAALVLLLKWNS